jgi:hypothetical protein
MWKKIKEFFMGKKKQAPKKDVIKPEVKVIHLYPKTPLQKRPTMRPNTKAQQPKPAEVAQWVSNVREVDKLRKKLARSA